jgi:hypothetical protein
MLSESLVIIPRWLSEGLTNKHFPEILICGTVAGVSWDKVDKIPLADRAAVSLDLILAMAQTLGSTSDMIPFTQATAVTSDERTVQIVDRGRGPQLSTCRITVQDLVPYLQQNCTWEQIQAIMPVLTVDEFQAIEGTCARTTTR